MSSSSFTIALITDPLEGFRSSIIEYAQKIEDLFAKMDGIRAEVLPPNRERVDYYFTDVWKRVHRLTDAAPSPLYLSFDPENFRSYLEAEEIRLSANLKAELSSTGRIPSRLLRVRDVLKRLALGSALRLFSTHLNGVDGVSAAQNSRLA